MSKIDEVAALVEKGKAKQIGAAVQEALSGKICNDGHTVCA